MPHGIPRGAMCVQRFDDSLNSAIHTTYRISLRSSSMPEPRDPLLKVLISFVCRRLLHTQKGFRLSPLAGEPAEETKGTQKTWVGISIGDTEALVGALMCQNCNDPSAGSPTERLVESNMYAEYLADNSSHPRLTFFLHYPTTQLKV
jgi:hypothetical protein